MQTATQTLWLEALAAQGLSGSDIFGRPGTQVEADVLVSESADGVNLNAIYKSQQEVLKAWNSERLAFAALLSYPTTVTGDAVPQNLASESFEEEGEFSIPKSMGQEPALLMGYPLRDMVIRQSWSWRYIRDATAEQLDNQLVRALEADAKLISGLILGRLFDPTEGVNEHGHRVFGLWNGTDGLNPPAHLGRTFPASTSHYWVSQNALLDSADVEDAIAALKSKGYGRSVGSQILILANPAESELIQSWRVGEESRPPTGGETSGPVARHSFIPSVNAPARLEPANIVGAVAPAQFNGLKVEGSYGPAWLIESEFVPSGYVAVVASSGADSPNNVVAMRQHPNPNWQGLRRIGGNWREYPLQDSFFMRTVGVGVRHRGAAVCIQAKASGSYDIPSIPR